PGTRSAESRSRESRFSSLDSLPVHYARHGHTAFRHHPPRTKRRHHKRRVQVTESSRYASFMPSIPRGGSTGGTRRHKTLYRTVTSRLNTPKGLMAKRPKNDSNLSIFPVSPIPSKPATNLRRE